MFFRFTCVYENMKLPFPIKCLKCQQTSLTSLIVIGSIYNIFPGKKKSDNNLAGKEFPWEV